MATSEEELTQARALAADGEFHRALAILEQLCDDEPYNAELWLEMAGVAEKAGLRGMAVAAMFHVADVFARAGVAEAADIAERVLELDPEHTGARRFVDMFKVRPISVAAPDHSVLAARPEDAPPSKKDALPAYWYADEHSMPIEVPLTGVSGRIKIGDTVESSAPLTVAPAEGFSGEDRRRLVQSLLQATSSRFVDALDDQAIDALIDTAKLRRCRRGDIIFREGEAGSELFLILKGNVDVERLDPRGTSRRLATLSPGAFFGEMAIVAGAPRSATVRAISDALLLEVSRLGVRELSDRDPGVRELLMRFFRARLVGTLMATSPIFTPLSVDERRSLVGRFRMRELPAQRTVLKQDTVCDGLYLVLVGRLAAYVELPEGDVAELGTLGSGDVFGEMSFITEEKAMASIVTVERSWVLRLPRKDLEQVIGKHPDVLKQLSEIAKMRRARNRETLTD